MAETHQVVDANEKLIDQGVACGDINLLVYLVAGLWIINRWEQVKDFIKNATGFA